ncbi:MAG: hypothetical protein KDD10_30340 [Phaeodactylibacter sp.]|nr:hypothetical protein [Phaeodactylibacter sp.]
MKNLFNEITENYSYHNEHHYEAFDKITDYLFNGWDLCTENEKMQYNGKKFHDVIPVDFIEEWCDNWDPESDGLQWAVDVILR